MGKTPAQENRLRAKKQGMSHEEVKKQQAADAKKIKQLEAQNVSFGMTKGAAMNKKHEVAMQRLKDMNDPTTELGKAHMRRSGRRRKSSSSFCCERRVST